MEEALKSTYQVGKYEYVSFDGSLWVKVFYHNYTNNATFANESEALSINTSDRYSVLGEISNWHRINGKFEFILLYPSLKYKYNRWKQTRSPTKEQDSKEKTGVAGYEPIHIDFTNNSWGGLAKNTYYGTLRSIGSMLWYYCIGKYSKTEGSWDNLKIPGPTGQVDEVYLWMKVHELADKLIITCKCQRKQYFLSYLLLVILIIS